MSQPRDALPVDAPELESPVSRLPQTLLSAVFALLRLDERLRCAEVCRAWRTAARDRSLWMRLDLSRAGGNFPISPLKCWPAEVKPRLAAALRCADGALQSLDLRGLDTQYWLEDFGQLLGGSASTLTELFAGTHVGYYYRLPMADVRSALRAAPALRVLHAAVETRASDLAELLRADGELAPVRISSAAVDSALTDFEAEAVAARACADAMAASTSLTQLQLREGWDKLATAGALEALIDGMRACSPLRHLSFTCFAPRPPVLPALTRLLNGNTLISLHLDWLDYNSHPGVADAADVAQFATALHGCTTLQRLDMRRAPRFDIPAFATMLTALAGHTSLQEMTCRWFGDYDEDFPEPAVAAIGDIISANAPALRCFALDIFGNFGGGDDAPDAFRHIFQALSVNTALSTFVCSHDGILLSDAFVRSAMLPALRANISLREFSVERLSDDLKREVDEIMTARR